MGNGGVAAKQGFQAPETPSRRCYTGWYAVSSLRVWGVGVLGPETASKPLNRSVV